MQNQPDPSQLYRASHTGTGEGTQGNDAERLKSTSGTADIHLESIEKEPERLLPKETIAAWREDRDKWWQQEMVLLQAPRRFGPFRKHTSNGGTIVVNGQTITKVGHNRLRLTSDKTALT